MEKTVQMRRKAIFTITMPVMLELLMGTLFGMVDMVMLGHSGTGAKMQASIAAIGISNQYQFIGLSLIASLTTGATAMIARYIGARRQDRVEPVLKHVLVLAMFGLALPLIAFGMWQTDAIMRFIGAQPDAIEAGRTYFRILVVAFGFQAFNFAAFSAMRGAADTRTPMRINFISNGINVVGNAVLIFGLFGFPRLGVTGAGIATAVSQSVATVFILFYLLSGRNIVKLDRKVPFRFDRNILINLARIGVPAALEQVLFRIGMLMYVRTVAGLGTTVYATHQISLSILNLSLTIGQSFATAASTLVGRSLGAQKPEEAERFMRESKNWSILFSMGVALFIFFFSPFVVRLYTGDRDIIELSSGVLKTIAIILPFQSAQFTLAGGLRGAGDTVWTLISTGMGVLLVRNVFAALFVNGMQLGLYGAWYALGVDQLVRWSLVRFRVHTQKWKDIHLL